MDKLPVSPDTYDLNPELADILRVRDDKQKGRKAPQHQRLTTAVDWTMKSEHEEQAVLFQWRDYTLLELPQLKRLHAIPNGQYRKGERPEAGMMRGVPDICLPYPVQHWHGFYGELKVGSNNTSKEQDEMIQDLRDAGYYVIVKWGWVAMAEGLMTYLDIPSNDQARLIQSFIAALSFV